jgi:hypothetical protein
MISFKEFITEVLRDPKRAGKLLDYLSKRMPSTSKHGDDDMDERRWRKNLIPSAKMPHVDWDVMADVFTNKMNSKPTRVPLHKIRTDQYDVNHFGVRKKIEHDDGKPAILIHDEKSNLYHVWDGNHRISAAHIQGKSDVHAHVIKLSDIEAATKKYHSGE